MPLIVFSVNTAILGITDLIAEGMENGGYFTLRHEFEKIPHPDTEYTLKQVYIKAAGAGREQGGFSRAETKSPMCWFDITFPQLDDETIVSRRHVTRIFRQSGGGNIEQFPDVLLEKDFGLLRFPITSFPVNGEQSSGYNCNVQDRQVNTAFGSRFDATGMHVCNLPLGRMKLKNNVIEVKFNVRDYLGRNAFDVGTGVGRRVRVRALQIILEYK